MVYIFINDNDSNLVITWTVGKTLPDLSKYKCASIHASGDELSVLLDAMRKVKK